MVASSAVCGVAAPAMAEGEGFPLAGQHWTLETHFNIGAYHVTGTVEFVFEENGCISMSSTGTDTPLDYDSCSSQFAVTGLDGSRPGEADLSFSYDFPYPSWYSGGMGGTPFEQSARASGTPSCQGMEIPEVGQEIFGCAMPDVTADQVTLTRTQ